jgi:hypothetical protein
MADDSKTPADSGNIRIRDLVGIINSVFRTAKTGVTVVELIVLREEVIIGFPQRESLENELKQIEWTAELQPGARYLLFAILNNKGYEVTTHVRLYLTANRRLMIEEEGSDAVALHDDKEAKGADIVKAVAEIAELTAPWASMVARIVLVYCGILPD